MCSISDDKLSEEFKDMIVRLNRIRNMIRGGQNIDAWFQIQGLNDKVQSLLKTVNSINKPTNAASLIQSHLSELAVCESEE